MTKVGTSGYCFHGLDLAVGNAVATADFAGTPTDTSAEVELPASSATFIEDTGCPAGTQAFVFTQAEGKATPQPFFVSLS